MIAFYMMEDSEYTPEFIRMPALVWIHFKMLDSVHAQCKYCEAILNVANGSTKVGDRERKREREQRETETETETDRQTEREREIERKRERKIEEQ